MKIVFHKMTRDFAMKIAGWNYEPPYNIYGYKGEDVDRVVEELTENENNFFAVTQAGSLIGFRSFGKDGRVNGGRYNEDYLDTGGGLRPDLTGKGLGSKVIFYGLEFGRRKYGTTRFRVTIADFNKRAMKACMKIGFRESDHFIRTSDKNPFTIFTIDLTENKTGILTTEAAPQA